MSAAAGNAAGGAGASAVNVDRATAQWNYIVSQVGGTLQHERIGDAYITHLRKAITAKPPRAMSAIKNIQSASDALRFAIQRKKERGAAANELRDIESQLAHTEEREASKARQLEAATSNKDTAEGKLSRIASIAASTAMDTLYSFFRASRDKVWDDLYNRAYITAFRHRGSITDLVTAAAITAVYSPITVDIFKAGVESIYRSSLEAMTPANAKNAEIEAATAVTPGVDAFTETKEIAVLANGIAAQHGILFNKDTPSEWMPYPELMELGWAESADTILYSNHIMTINDTKNGLTYVLPAIDENDIIVARIDEDRDESSSYEYLYNLSFITAYFNLDVYIPKNSERPCMLELVVWPAGWSGPYTVYSKDISPALAYAILNVAAMSAPMPAAGGHGGRRRRPTRRHKRKTHRRRTNRRKGRKTQHRRKH